MKAAVYRRPGPAADVLEVVDMAVPELEAGQVCVRIVYSGINPTDWKTRAGLTKRVVDDFQIPHQDGAGIVEAVGPHVKPDLVGKPVWVHLAAFENRYGTAAEFTILAADRVAPLPADVPFQLGACLGVPAVTAAHCLGDRGDLSGQTVLVTGGAGAVGHYAIQLAKQAGATVVTTVSSEIKAEQAREAGADAAVLYTELGAGRRILDAVGPVDRVVDVDITTNLDLDLEVLASGGVIASYAVASDLTIPAGHLMMSNQSLRFMLLYGLKPSQRARAVNWVSDALRVGALTLLPSTEYPLEQIVAAQEAAAEGSRGKVLVRVAR